MRTRTPIPTHFTLIAAPTSRKVLARPRRASSVIRFTCPKETRAHGRPAGGIGRNGTTGKREGERKGNGGQRRVAQRRWSERGRPNSVVGPWTTLAPSTCLPVIDQSQLAVGTQDISGVRVRVEAAVDQNLVPTAAGKAVHQHARTQACGGMWHRDEEGHEGARGASHLPGSAAGDSRAALCRVLCQSVVSSVLERTDPRIAKRATIRAVRELLEQPREEAQTRESRRGR